jgi:hypothetical protein
MNDIQSNNRAYPILGVNHEKNCLLSTKLISLSISLSPRRKFYFPTVKSFDANEPNIAFGLDTASLDSMLDRKLQIHAPLQA